MLADVVIGLGTAARIRGGAILGCAIIYPENPENRLRAHSRKSFVFLKFFDGLDFLILGDRLAVSPLLTPLFSRANSPILALSYL
jgi:hypothetical protein